MTATARMVLAALSAIAIMVSAQAAEIALIRGEILANSGSGYRAIEGAEQLKSGDAIVPSLHSIGKLTYPDGCVVDVAPGSVTWVQSRSPCSLGADQRSRQDPAPTLPPRMAFNPVWLIEGAKQLVVRKPPAGP